jgi:hypothetical protein
MGSFSTATFCKRKTCPATELVLRYREAKLDPTSERVVSAHLAECDFCGAELSLLVKYPPPGLPRFMPVPMPASLYWLGKSLPGGASSAARSHSS